MALCSIAIAAGVIGIVAVVKRLIFRRRFGGPMAFAGCGSGFGMMGGGHHHHGPWGRRWGGGPGRSFWLRGLFYQLDTTPGQEREIRAAVEDFQHVAFDARGRFGEMRSDLSRAVSGESFDETAVGEANTRVEAVASTVKEAFTGALKRIHGVLDPKQRERLAEIIDKGPRFSSRWGGPYRDGTR